MAYSNFTDWGTYYLRSGTSNPSPGQFGLDQQVRFDVDTDTIEDDNKTLVRVRPYLKCYCGGTEGYVYTWPTTITTTINGVSSTQSISEKSIAPDSGQFQSFRYKYFYGSYQYFTINHNSTTGVATLSLSGKAVMGGVTRTCATSGSLPTIPRMPQISSLSLSSSSFHEFKATVSVSLPATRFLLYDDDGNKLGDTGTISSRNSYTFNFNKQLANTTYNLRARASNSIGYGSYSSYKSIKTSSVPSVITNNATFTDEGNLSLNHYISTDYTREFELYIGSTLIKKYSGVTYTPYILTFTEDERITMRNLITTGDSISVVVESSCYVDTTKYIANTTTHTLKLINANPELSINDISYEDFNPVSLALTGSKYKVINKISNIQATLSGSIAKKGATIDRVIFTIGSVQVNEPAQVGGIAIGILNSIDGLSLAVSVIDSRGLSSASVTKNFDTFIDYTEPILSNVSTIRNNNGTGTKLNIDISGSITLFTGLETSNIANLYFKYKESTSTEYSDFINIGNAIIDSSGKFNTKYTTNDLYLFEISKKYDIIVKVEDKLSSVELSTNVDTAEVLIAIDKINKFVGINKIPEYNLDVDGNINISGDYMIDGVNIIPEKIQKSTIIARISNNKTIDVVSWEFNTIPFDEVLLSIGDNFSLIDNKIHIQNPCNVKVSLLITSGDGNKGYIYPSLNQFSHYQTRITNNNESALFIGVVKAANIISGAIRSSYTGTCTLTGHQAYTYILVEELE